MKKTLLIIVSIFLVVIFLGFRLVYTKLHGGKEERLWYIQGLHYNFSARVDTVIMVNGNVGLGKLVCNLTTGKPDPTVEDSLNEHLTHHKSLRFLFPSVHHNQVEFFVPGAEHHQRGDSVVVNSADNTISFFRNGNELSHHDLSYTLEARGNPITF